MHSTTDIDVGNMLIILEINMNSLMLMGHLYKKNQVPQNVCFIHVLYEVEHNEGNDSVVLLEY